MPAIWALKTFYRTAQVDFPLVIHVNGTPVRAVFDRLHSHFPDATLVPRDVADKSVEPRLIAAGLHRLAAARRTSPFMVKLTDFPLLAEGAVVLGFDSDVLFFAKPREILDQCARPTPGYLFQRDIESTYNISTEDALREFGVHLAARVNTGFLVYPRDLPDMAAFERYLEHPGVARTNGFIEQTLYALHASEIASVAYLPEGYLIDTRAGLPFDELTARHYAGPTRPLLTSEGMPQILRSGLLKDGEIMKSRPRVLHVVPALFGDGGVFGGAERYALELARHMAEISGDTIPDRLGEFRYAHELARHMADKTPTRLVTFADVPARRDVGRLDVRLPGRAWLVTADWFAWLRMSL